MAAIQDHIALIAKDFDRLCIKPLDSAVKSDHFVDGYENPVSWHKRYNVPREQLTKDILFDNLDMKNMTLAQYYHNIPEYIKWKLFGYNIVISYEYISKTQLNEALESINDTVDILSSINSKDVFLISIKAAIKHVTYSLKGYIMSLCNLKTMDLEDFDTVNNMDNVNKAALFGIQSIFFYEYGLPCIQISGDCALKAISLNDNESEWHYLMSKVLTFYSRNIGSNQFSLDEIGEAKTAVRLGNKPHHKLHLVHVYQRMSKNIIDFKTDILVSEASYILLKDVMKETNDLFLLKNCLLSLSKVEVKEQSSVISETLEKLVKKLESSNNGYIHGAIGHYYLFYKKDYEKAKFHLKLAVDVKSFGASIDYVYTFYRLNPNSTPVENMLAQFLDVFPHQIHQEKLLSQIISFLIVTKKDIMKSLEYISQMLTIKHIACVYSMQNHNMKFSLVYKRFNLLEIIPEKLQVAIHNNELTSGDINKIKIVLTKFEMYISSLNPKMVSKNIHMYKYKDNDKFNDNKQIWRKHKSNQDQEKLRNEENWRKLKPEKMSRYLQHNFNNRPKSNENERKNVFIKKNDKIFL